MKKFNYKPNPPRRMGSPLCLVLAGLLLLVPALNSGLAQDVKVNIGNREDTELAKQTKEMAEKLPPTEQAAYLKSYQRWNSVESIAQTIMFLGLPIAIVALVLTFRHRRQRLAHETMRLMIERGLTVPPELINPPPPVKPPKNDLRRGLVWGALGIGLLIAIKETIPDEQFWAFALVPTFIGAAYLVCWLVAWMRERQERQADGLWPGILWTSCGVALFIAMRAMKDANNDWDHVADWAGFGLLPTALGLAFLVHYLILWLIRRNKSTPG